MNSVAIAGEPTTLAQMHAARVERMKRVGTYAVQRPVEINFDLAEAINFIAIARWWSVELSQRVSVSDRRKARALLRGGRRLRKQRVELRVKARGEYAKAYGRVREMVVSVASAHEVPVSEMLGESRIKPLCEARFDLFYRMRLAGLSLAQIGRRVGGRDHTTVLNGIRRHCQINSLPLPPVPVWKL